MKSKKHKMKIYKYLGIATFFLVFFDQATKFLSRLYLYDYIQIFPEIGLMHYQNTGVAFSLAIPTIITVPVAILVGFGIIYALYKQKNPKSLESIALMLILSGAIGNALDRAFFGYVTDFFMVGNFPIFNMADVYITWGIILMGIEAIKESIHKKSSE